MIKSMLHFTTPKVCEKSPAHLLHGFLLTSLDHSHRRVYDCNKQVIYTGCQEGQAICKGGQVT